jgi:hypothetical protein
VTNEGTSRAGKETIMWVFDGENWTEEGGNRGNESPAMIDYSRYQELQPQLQIQEIERDRPALRNPMPWVPVRRIKP